MQLVPNGKTAGTVRVAEISEKEVVPMHMGNKISCFLGFPPDHMGVVATG